MRYLYLLRSGEYMPLLLTLPPTSLTPFRDFLSKAFTLRRRGTSGSLVRIGIKKMSNGKDEYGVATFQRMCDFTGEQLVQIRAYADGFKEQMKATLEQRAAANVGQRDDGCDYEEGGRLPASAGEVYAIATGAIDGEREALPA